MKLICLNPFAPGDPKAKALFAAVAEREFKALRRKPIFWLSLIVTVFASLSLGVFLDRTEQIVLMVVFFGAGILHDMVNSHFINRIIEIEAAKSVSEQVVLK